MVENVCYEENLYFMISCRNGNTFTLHEKLKCLHECIEYCLPDLSNDAVKGIYVHSKDGEHIHPPVILSSYIGDLIQRYARCEV